MTKNEMKYSDALNELEEILGKIDRGELDIDELSSAVKRASYLMKVCRNKLHKTEKEVEKILSEMDKETPGHDEN